MARPGAEGALVGSVDEGLTDDVDVAANAFILCWGFGFDVEELVSESWVAGAEDLGFFAWGTKHSQK